MYPKFYQEKLKKAAIGQKDLYLDSSLVGIQEALVNQCGSEGVGLDEDRAFGVI